MLGASIFSHIALGALLSLIFILYYINSDSKWKITNLIQLIEFVEKT